MDANTVNEANAAYEDTNTAELEWQPGSELTNIELTEGISFNGDIMQEVGTAGKVLTRVELDLAFFSEKLVNLDKLMMHVGTRESDFDAFVSETEHISGDSMMKAMEFDLLSGILDSEVREFDNFMSTVQTEIDVAHEIVSSSKHLGQALKELEDKLHDSEESMKQTLEKISEIKVQSANFQKILSSFGGEENGKGNNGGELLNQNAKIKMQTAEQQRHFLRMLEKSLARELDLEKKVGESRQNEEELTLRLHSSEQEVFFMEEEAAIIWERCFEAENATEVMMGVSKEILGQLQIVHFNLNGSIQREENLRFELQDSMEKLNAKDCAMQKLEDKLALAHSEAANLREKVSSLEMHLKESETELLNAKTSADASQALYSKMHEMEKQLRESDILLQHALATVEANQEKENMLYSTIHDMENLIEDMKSRVSKSESRAESAEEKCITLSESNANLNEELRFIRSRLGSLETSMHQAEATKMATAKDIGIQTKMITDLVMQLALERERLHKQISALTKENKILLHQADKDPSRTMSHGGRGNGKDLLFSKHVFSDVTCAKESKEASDFSATSVEVDNTPNTTSIGDAALGPADITSKLETVRNIDARQLNFNYGFIVILTLAVSALAAFLFQQA